MNRFHSCFALLLVCGSSGLGHAEDRPGPEPDPDTIIRKAMEARGGKEALAKYVGYKWHAKARVIIANQAGLAKIEYLYCNDPMSFRVSGEIELSSKTMKETKVFDGNTTWENRDGTMREGNAASVQECCSKAYDDGVAYLFDLLNKRRFTLSRIPAKNVNGTEAFGVRVSSRGYHDVLLYFDKNTYHLLKMESKQGEKYPRGESYDVYYKDYKELKGGVMHFTRKTIRSPGRQDANWELVEIEPLTEVKDSEFAKPKGE